MADKNEYVGHLVRDRIPEILRKEGYYPMTRVLNDEEYLFQLHHALSKAIRIYLHQGSLSDLADVTEIINAIAQMRGVSVEEVLKIREYRAMTYGAYENRYYLEKLLTPEEKEQMDKREEEMGFEVQF
ncbi:MAG: nucleoside triphosphate pyrophosphohydrolase [Firmicutes bacterium]|jgi:predicted house-cleaning noncanonical NTP pyrophosphatase (MazG superfamily)|nr:nucleoside triphosphate pyrophosphohydrolase [Bacillota bacterium]